MFFLATRGKCHDEFDSERDCIGDRIDKRFSIYSMGHTIMYCMAYVNDHI